MKYHATNHGPEEELLILSYIIDGLRFNIYCALELHYCQNFSMIAFSPQKCCICCPVIYRDLEDYSIHIQRNRHYPWLSEFRDMLSFFILL